MITRALVAATAIALGGTLAATAPGNAAAPARADAGMQSASPGPASSTIRWHDCSGALAGLKCGKVTVPLDYSHPRGRTITLAVTMRKHSSSRARYRGAILVNPGGPGGSGRWLANIGLWVPNGVGDQFDWIGFDPRGVGASRPALHCDTSYFGFDRPSYVPTGPKLLKHWRSVTTKYAKDCGRSKAKRLLPHLTTKDSVRDMDQIRKALGKSKISFYGFSYGSYLGQVYMTMFPKHLKRVVLDGVVDPTRVWYGANLDQDRAFDANMNVFWKWMAKGNPSYHLGTNWKQIRAGYYRELAKLRKHPAAGGRLGPDELADAMLDAGYYVYGWRDDAAAYAKLINKHNGKALLKAYRTGNVGAAAENGYAIYAGVECVDNPWPGWAKTLKDSRRIYKVAPFETWGNTWFNAPCISWPAKSTHRIHVRQKAGQPKFLLVSETKDAATPYSGALRVRSIFKSARLIAGVGGTTHASSLSGVRCTDDRIAHYLATGKVPARVKGKRADVRCKPFSPPPPNGRIAAARTEVIANRAALLAAQHWSLR